ncbi:MAG: VWA domain-containing protein, partial [Bryobacteraceae bacterium]
MFLALFLAGATMAQQPTPTIRVTTRLVNVNVIVREKGKPVAGLTAGDFQVFDNGKPQKIAFFAMTGQEQRSEPTTKREPNVFSNRDTPSGENPTSATVLLLDGLNTRFSDQAYARQHIRNFLREVNPDDKIAIYVLGRRLKVLNDFTDDRDHLARVLARYRGENTTQVDPLDDSDIFGDEGLIDASVAKEREFSDRNRSRTTMAVFNAVAKHLARLPGRKSVIWVSSSFPIFLYDVERNLKPEVDQVTRWFSNANIAIYPVDARGLVGASTYATASVRFPEQRERSAANMETLRILA